MIDPVLLLIISLLDLALSIYISIKLLVSIVTDNNNDDNKYLSCFANKRRIGSITDGRCGGSEAAHKHNCIDCPYLREDLKKKG